MKYKRIMHIAAFTLTVFFMVKPVLAQDYLKEGAFGKFCEEAREIVRKNSEIFKYNLAFKIDKTFPTARFFSDAKGQRTSMLSNKSSYKSLKGSKESGLEIHVKNYDIMMVRRMNFFEKAADAMNEPFRSRKVILYDAMDFWGKNRDKAMHMASNQRQGETTLKQIKADYDDLKNRMSQPGPQALSSNNQLKALFVNKTLNWPPQRSQMENLKLNEIYKVPWLTSSLEVDSNTKSTLNMLDKYVDTDLKEYPRLLEEFNKVMSTVWDANKNCAGLGQDLKNTIQSDRNSDLSLNFGLREAMLEAADLEILLIKHHEDELNNAKSDYDDFKKFFAIPQVSELYKKQFWPFINARGGKENSMLKAMESYGKEMQEYRKKFKDLAR